MEREIFLTGIGGQGVQLAAKILALAATIEGRQVMSLGTYGGTMRGGNTDGTIVVADGPIVSPPIASRGWAALVVHPQFWQPVRRKLRPDSIVVLDGDLAADTPGASDFTTFPVSAAAIARDVGAPMAGALVLLSAFCGTTGLVALDSLVAAMRDAIPPYRSQHIERNTKALEVGFGSLPCGGAAAWPAPTTVAAES
jgi:Pyruvate/2-oxoacid:ferredoxin oxidoreductase gamma subunit